MQQIVGIHAAKTDDQKDNLKVTLESPKSLSKEISLCRRSNIGKILRHIYSNHLVIHTEEGHMVSPMYTFDYSYSVKVAKFQLPPPQKKISGYYWIPPTLISSICHLQEWIFTGHQERENHPLSFLVNHRKALATEGELKSLRIIAWFHFLTTGSSSNLTPEMKNLLFLSFNWAIIVELQKLG